MTTQRDELDHDYGSVMQQAWDNGIGNFSGTILGDTALQFDAEGIPILGEYMFGMMIMIPRFSGD
jgi:peroxin-5